MMRAEEDSGMKMTDAGLARVETEDFAKALDHIRHLAPRRLARGLMETYTMMALVSDEENFVAASKDELAAFWQANAGFIGQTVDRVLAKGVRCGCWA